jgi:hypothetical protein
VCFCEVENDFSYPNWKSKRMRWVGQLARTGERRCAYRVLVGNPEGMRLLRRPERRWEDNIKMNLLDMRWGMDLIDLAQDRGRCRAFVNVVLNFRVI